jgi:hypothetical protein
MEDTQFGRRITDAFDHFTFDVPLDAIATVRQRRPRWSQRQIMALATLPAVAVLVIAFLVGQSLATPASVFASWQPLPSVANGPLAASARSLCLGSTDMNAALILQDQRGRAAAFLYQSADNLISCVAAVDASGQVVATSSSFQHITVATEPFGIDGTSRSAGQGTAETGLSRVFGHQAAGVAVVSLTLSDGNQVTASIGQDRFLAWWPSSATVVSMAALDAKGSLLAEKQAPEPGT